MKPLVSILIPAYNAEKWIPDTLRSALAQTWEPKEIIVVDDGSKDRTLEVARRFECETLRVVTQRNQGAAAARNAALSLSKGDYIQWLDADDLLAPDKIATQMRLVEQGLGRRTLLSSSFGGFMYRPSRARFKPSPLWSDLSPAEFLMRKMENKVYMQTSVWLVSRELTEAAGPWDVTTISDDDGEYFCRVLMASDAVKFVPESRMYYRSVGTTSLSYVGRSEKKLEALWRSMQLHIRHLRSLDDGPRARAACVTFLQNYLIDFYPLKLDIAQEMRNMARELGGHLNEPRLPWKYSWIKRIFGWDSATRAQQLVPNVRWSLVRYWDQALFNLEKRGSESVPFEPKALVR